MYLYIPLSHLTSEDIANEKNTLKTLNGTDYGITVNNRSVNDTPPFKDTIV
jgi:hypothetical protein